MSSGRSARLPPTPTPTSTSTQNANNKHRVAAATSAAAAAAAGEPNSNNMLQYSSGNATANGSAGSASGLGVSGLQMGMNMGMGSMSSGMLPSGFGLGQMSGGASTATTDVGTDSIPGETIDALGPELAVATSQVLENLSENERKMIIEVLNRDESVRQRDATRIMLLRAELYALRCKVVGEAGVQSQPMPLDATQQQQEQQQQDPNQQQQTMLEQQQQLEHNNHKNLHNDLSRHCARCTTELGRITNRGAPCRVCKLRVCKACRVHHALDWVCVVCHKQLELQAASGEWLKEAYASCEAVDHLSTSDVLRKSIRRSWTISNPEDDPNNPNAQQPVTDNLYPQQQHLIEAQSAGSYPTLHQHTLHQQMQQQQQQQQQQLQQQLPLQQQQQHQPPPQPRQTHIINYNSGTATPITGSKWQLGRRVLRQSTLPSTLSNDPNLSGSGANLANYNSANLTAPTSPHQIQKSPLYPSAYNSDDIIHMNIAPDCDNYSQIQIQQQQPQLEAAASPPTHSHRLQVRRQSTLPANPCQPPPSIYMSTSPNRVYSRSPERSPGEQRYPPFTRQTSFPEPPSNNYHRTKLLPNTANLTAPTNQSSPVVAAAAAPPLNYESQASSMASDDMDYSQAFGKPRMTRQATLPNPEQHVKLLPTSPPKRQTSPQFRRSPEFTRQQTLPNPEAFNSGNTLTVHQTPPGKFMPISPRAKQNFLFPSVQNPRQFLSQQNVPTVGGVDLGSGGSVASATGEQYSSSQSVNIHHSRDPHSKMIKVRSHSNEEYSNSTKTHVESRRLLPEIPTTQRSQSRSPSRLVRQDCLKEQEHGSRTFGEAKQQFCQFPDVSEELETRPEYVDYFGNSTTSFLESDEVQYEKNYNAGFSSEPRIIYNDGADDAAYKPTLPRPMYGSENVVTGGDGGYGAGAPMPGFYSDMHATHSGAVLPRTPLMHNRMRRRQSRELPAQPQEDYAAGLTEPTAAAAAPPVASATVGAASLAVDNSADRRKPEQVRSVSEDSGAKTAPKPVTRRSFSHPEKESTPPKKTEASKIPSPRPLADILDKTRGGATKIPLARRRNSRGEEGRVPQHHYSFHELLKHQNSDLSNRMKKTTIPVNTVPAKEDEQAASGAVAEAAAKATDKDPDATNNEANDTAGAAAHTSTLGEQELQNAVEAAAVVFKKVVLQRRKEKEKEKAAEEEEARAAADELSKSPVIGQRNPDAAASSPIQSRASSETWPAQSDEDIDRLVAMHQNRSSLSSLGVRSESMASVYSGAGEGRYGTVVVKGQVEFGMQYNYKLGALEIHVVRCKDLAAVDAKRNRSDPYVKVYLLPDKSKAGKRKTKVKKHTLNPIFDETLRFHTSLASLESKTLWLTVWHSDMFGRNDFLGEVSVNLQGRLFDNPQSQWYLLQERSEPFDDVATYRGDIVVGLKYVPPENLKSSIFSRGSSLTGSSSNLRKFGGSIKSVTSKSDRSAKGGQLHVLVKEAKHLSPIKTNGTCDAFCKSYLLPDRTRSSKQKTPVVKRTLHPSWNYTFVYEDVSLKDLSERALELTVWDHDRLASNEFIGGIRFSTGTGRSYGRQVDWMDATGKEVSLWQNMLDRPNFWVEGSLVLRSSLDGIRSTLP
ncbi:PREDICTED: uncharacterized protein LOC108619066 isoform X9 [Drosophila arizonae]|uniref:Uncharacterized protein LOC108619066 isoform X9 n=1 Tax=Drosophila arizonae TaxID=7263 RepID=A0ABM1PUP2_DROAR|nr:PREDICTED: uncharacterized protein LOC108619066 isoform X9 [Drosophila arizonae]